MRKRSAPQAIGLAAALVGCVLLAMALAHPTRDVRAQDQSPICPPGFEWQRMSGVGCVQTDCAEMGGRYSYTVACICNDGLKTCSEPVDYTNFDSEACSIWCPGWRLTACVDLESLCPGDEFPATELPDELPAEELIPNREEPPREEVYPDSPLEEILLGDHAHPPAPGRAAAAAAVGAVLVGASALVQFFSQGGFTGLQKSAADLSQAAVKHSADTPAPDDLRGTLAGLATDALDVVDKWPGGNKPPGSKQGIDLPPAIQPETAPGSEVFHGEDARSILVEMGKLLPDRNLAVGSEGLGIYTGPQREGLTKRVRLTSGRVIFVKEILGVVVEGLAGVSSGLLEVEFDQRVALTALLTPEAPADLLEAPTIRPPLPEDPFEAPTIMREDPGLPDDDEDGKEEA